MARLWPPASPIKAVVYPLAQPTARDALTFDIRAASPDFLIPGGEPVHFDIKTCQRGTDRDCGFSVRFEIDDYLTQVPIGLRVTEVKAGR